MANIGNLPNTGKIEAAARKRFRKLKRAYDELRAIGKRSQRKSFRNKREDKARTAFRDGTLWAEDGLARERILDDNDLFHVNYFDQARRAAGAVCKIHINDQSGIPRGYGTGFIVGEGLLLTNNHVLTDRDWARGSHAEFEFEYDITYRTKRTMSFKLLPDELFLTDPDLDFTFVAVAATGSDDVPLAGYGALPLLPASGKAVVDEPVTIIQHPGGGLKQVALRHSRIIGIAGDPPDDHFIHYTTDTERGSSGSPVLNDQWQVVALHHAGVPGPTGGWIANEGTRISRIIAAVRDVEGPEEGEAATILRRVGAAVENGIGVTLPSTPAISAAAAGGVPVTEAAPFKPSRWPGNAGYQEDFLGGGVTAPIPLPPSPGDLATVDGGGVELKYTHYSVVMSRSRRLAYVAAVNIDGARQVPLPREKDKWRLDPRLKKNLQIDNDAYASNDFDRGHLVRRLSPVWGSKRVATKANDDTFHYTNCAPQHKDLNRKTWLDLEDYILKTAGREGARACVFTGPVFRPDDRLYRNRYRIPSDYWKVAAMRKRGKLVAAAYLQSQKDLVGDVAEAAFGDYKTYRVPVRLIAELTGLDFGPLVAADRRSVQESATGITVVTGPKDAGVR